MPTQKTVSNRLQSSLLAIKRFVISKTVAVQRLDGTYFPVWMADKWHLKLQERQSFRFFNIFERSLYNEFHKPYPIQDIRDLKSVLLQEYGSSTQHQISPISQSIRQVSSYVFDKQHISFVRMPCFVIPASILLAKAIPQDRVTLHIAENVPWFLAKFAKQVLSQTQSDFISDANRFKFTQGLPEDLEHQELTKDDSWQYILKGTANLNLTDLGAFYRYPQASLTSINWKPYSVMAVVLALFYMVVGSLIINFQTERRSEQITAMGNELNSLLDKQLALTVDIAAINALSDFQNKQVQVAPTWYLVKYLLDDSTTLLDIRQSLFSIELRGRSARATDVLIKLRENNFVKSAEFTSPTVKTQNLEEFTIRIMLNQSGHHAVE